LADFFKNIPQGASLKTPVKPMLLKQQPLAARHHGN